MLICLGPYIIGLTGGSASGKSSVGRRLKVGNIIKNKRYFFYYKKYACLVVGIIIGQLYLNNA